jgi:integrase
MSTILNLNACPWKRLFPCAFDVCRGQKGVKVASTSMKTLVQQGGPGPSVWCSRRVRFLGRAPRIQSMFPKDFLRTTSAHRLREAIGGHRQRAYLRILFQDEPEVGSPGEIRTSNPSVNSCGAHLSHRVRSIQPDVRMLRTREDIGRAISRDEDDALLEACRASRSRSLYPAVLVALNTCMRYSELRLLRWRQVDLNACTLTVGHSKTESGTGRLLPLNDRAVAILSFWASLFPLREPRHFVFPSERYGASGDGATVVYNSDPTRPIGRWKEAWESAKIRAAISCRFHDLRHTGCSRMLEAGVPFSVVATIMGWSPSTTVRMARRYGHISQTAQRQAVDALKGADFETERTQSWAQSQKARVRQLVN